MLKKSLIVAGLLLLLIALVPAQADSNMESVFCGDLPAQDCQILLDNAIVMDAVSAFSFSGAMTMSADFDDPFELTASASGDIEFDGGALQRVNDMSADIAAADIAELGEVMLTTTKAEISFALSGWLGEEALDMELSLLLKDGVVLLGAEALEAVTGEPMTGLDAFGLDLSGAVADLLDESDAMPAHEKDGVAIMESGATTITRLADSEVNGAPVAVFETATDLNALFALVNAAELMDGIAVNAFESRHYIGLDDGYSYRTELDMSLTDASYGEGSISLDMVVDLSNFNQPVAVEIPEDAFVIPLAMMMMMAESDA